MSCKCKSPDVRFYNKVTQSFHNGGNFIDGSYSSFYYPYYNKYYLSDCCKHGKHKYPYYYLSHYDPAYLNFFEIVDSNFPSMSKSYKKILKRKSYYY